MAAHRRTAKEIAMEVTTFWPAVVDRQARDLEPWDEGDAFAPDLVRRRRELVVLAGAAPLAAVLQAWAELEGSLRAAGRRWDMPASTTAYQLLQRLPPRSGLRPSARKAINELRRVRNAAAHASAPVTASEAADFVVVALQLSVHVDFMTDAAYDDHFVPGWRDSLAAGEL